MAHCVNQDVAGRLEEAAKLLRDHGGDPYRVNAYRRAAMTVRGSAKPVDEVFQVEQVRRYAPGQLVASQRPEPDAALATVKGTRHDRD